MCLYNALRHNPYNSGLDLQSVWSQSITDTSACNAHMGKLPFPGKTQILPQRTPSAIKRLQHQLEKQLRDTDGQRQELVFFRDNKVLVIPCVLFGLHTFLSKYCLLQRGEIHRKFIEKDEPNMPFFFFQEVGSIIGKVCCWLTYFSFKVDLEFSIIKRVADLSLRCFFPSTERRICEEDERRGDFLAFALIRTC